MVISPGRHGFISAYSDTILILWLAFLLLSFFDASKNMAFLKDFRMSLATSKAFFLCEL